MGFYINPKSESKESFLKREGISLDKAPKWEDVPPKHMIVILVDNGPFTAAGIAFDEQEYKDFTNPGDWRKKKFYFVPIEKLYDVTSNDFREYLEKNNHFKAIN